ncbi:MAG: DNA primase [Oscillospiraceae bacterium]|nr:DNA primase [Oscillospiraceae bacterium]
MAFPDHFLDELSSRTDMLELVRQYLPLQLRGGRWWGRCPFHSEKDPSFSVTPEKGAFYCFGCQAGGGAIQFLMMSENLDFHDAVELLARHAGLEVPEDGDRGYSIKRNRMAQINRFAARWFYENLGTPEGEAAVAYMKERGILPKFARRFGLGYAPDRWDGLLVAAAVEGIGSDELIYCGLTTKGERGGLYDSFRNRLIFPIFDMKGQIIAFSGRALDNSPAKYKNSPETPLYKKRNTLYGSNWAKNTKRQYWILCEGNMDVLMLHQAGFDCAVASCGTALTDTQTRLIARCTKEVVLSYDADNAGQKAAGKATSLLENDGLKVRVLQIPGAKDPDEYILKNGSAAFERLVENSGSAVEYHLRQIEALHDLGSDSGKIEFLRQAASLLAKLPGQSERQVYAGRIAERLSIDSKAVMRDVESQSRRKEKKEKLEISAALLRTGKRDETKAEKMLVTILLQRPDLLERCSRLSTEDFSNTDCKNLFSAMKMGQNPMYDPELSKIAAALLARPDLPDPMGSDEVLQDCVSRIIEISQMRNIPALERYQELKEKKKYGG